MKKAWALTALMFANAMILGMLWHTTRSAASSAVESNADPLVKQVMEDKFGDVSAREGLFARQLHLNDVRDLAEIIARIEALEKAVEE